MNISMSDAALYYIGGIRFSLIDNNSRMAGWSLWASAKKAFTLPIGLGWGEQIIDIQSITTNKTSSGYPYRVGSAVSAIKAFGLSCVALADDCKFQNGQFVAKSAEVVSCDEVECPLEGFELCAVDPLRRTINGRIVSCLNFADVVPSDNIWGDDGFRFLAVKSAEDGIDSPEISSKPYKHGQQQER